MTILGPLTWPILVFMQALRFSGTLKSLLANRAVLTSVKRATSQSPLQGGATLRNEDVCSLFAATIM
jgi:ABC-type maltose transport system permease subunit